MGLLGDIVGGVIRGLFNAARESNEIRHASHGMSDDELRMRTYEALKNKDYISAAGYKSAYEDNHKK